jgi:hypothetical protein
VKQPDIFSQQLALCDPDAHHSSPQDRSALSQRGFLFFARLHLANPVFRTLLLVALYAECNGLTTPSLAEMGKCCLRKLKRCFHLANTGC